MWSDFLALHPRPRPSGWVFVIPALHDYIISYINPYWGTLPARSSIMAFVDFNTEITNLSAADGSADCSSYCGLQTRQFTCKSRCSSTRAIFPSATHDDHEPDAFTVVYFGVPAACGLNVREPRTDCNCECGGGGCP